MNKASQSAIGLQRMQDRELSGDVGDDASLSSFPVPIPPNTVKTQIARSLQFLFPLAPPTDP
jgi:hypothetical protein